jgi:outer membrane protein W
MTYMPRSRTLALLAAIAWPAVARAEPPPPSAAGPPPARTFYFRAGGALIAPVTSSREAELADVDGPASLAVQNGPIAGSGANVESATIPAIIVGYVLPLGRRRWSLEAVLGVPFTVRFQSTGTLANMSIAPTALGIPTGIGPLGPELGEAKAVPPVVTAVYQLLDRGAVRPYLGGGASVLFTYDAHVTNPTLTAVGEPDMSISPAPGIVVQGGLDVRLWNTVYARLDVKFIALMKAHAEVRNIQVETPALPLFESVEVGTAKMDLWVNPFIVQGGVGVDF